MATDRKTYTKEFKMEVLQLLESTLKSQAQIERELGIGQGNISRWKTELQEHGQQKAFPGKGKALDAEDEVRRLERENQILRQEVEILKKALGIFSKDRQ